MHRRPTAEQLLYHPWIRLHCTNSPSYPLSTATSSRDIQLPPTVQYATALDPNYRWDTTVSPSTVPNHPPLDSLS